MKPSKDFTDAIQTLAGVRIVVVEDEALLALALEDELKAAGCEVIGSFASVETALSAVRREDFDFAILDVNLRGQRSFPVADELIAKGRRFLFLSGYGGLETPERFKSIPRLAKPYNPSDLMAQIRRALPAPEEQGPPSAEGV